MHVLASYNPLTYPLIFVAFALVAHLRRSKGLGFVCFAYLGGSRNRSERSQISRSFSNDLVVPVHFEVGQELCFCFLDQPLLVLLKLKLFFSR
jgi:hypothetical protein